MMRSIPALVLLLLAESPSFAVSLPNNCRACVHGGNLWWSERWGTNGYCADGCGMDGCGASVCASDLDTCADCLGGSGTPAAGQYSWSPFSGAAGECLESCRDAPADAPCYAAKSHLDPSKGYEPTICPSISVCRSKSSCTDCLEGGACAWSTGSCYDSCNEYDVPADASCFEGKRYSPSEACSSSASTVDEGHFTLMDN
ncbi:hypothetical protein ACHAWF_003525 [Thalassiosira exigua]